VPAASGPAAVIAGERGVSPVEAEQPTYVYGLVKADTEIPDGLTGLGPSGRVLTIAFGRVAAIVSDVPTDRPLGVRGDLVAHEGVLAAVAARDAVVPMRFPAVVEEHAVVDELRAPNEEHFTALLDSLQGRCQFTLTGRYEQDAVLREVLEGDEEIRALREKVRELPEDAAYYDRVRLGELIVRARAASADRGSEHPGPARAVRRGNGVQPTRYGRGSGQRRVPRRAGPAGGVRERGGRCRRGARRSGAAAAPGTSRPGPRSSPWDW